MHPFIYLLGIKIPSYGVMAALAAVTIGVLFLITRRKFSLPLDIFITSLLYGLVGAYIGAKLLYCIVEWKTIFCSGNVLINIFNSGLVFYGGLIGALLMEMLYAKKAGMELYTLTDAIVPCGCAGHALGRVGCFLAGCCYGCETDSVFGVIYPEGGIAPAGVRLLPTQLFEAIFLMLLSAVLMIVLYKQKRKGLTTGIYFIAYSAWRFIIEFFRSDSRGSVGALSTSQFISLFIFAFGVFVLIKRFIDARKTRTIID